MNQQYQEQLIKFQQLINGVCESINKQIDDDTNNLILQVGEKILKIAQSFKDEVKINFQEFQVGMTDLNVDKVLQLSKRIEKILTKKIERLKEHVSEFVEYRLDQASEERTTVEKYNRREEIDKITTSIKSRKIYTCPVCFTQYYSLNHLNAHLKQDHNTKFFQNLSCPSCGQLFENPRTLTHHLWAQHAVKKTIFSYTCGGCNLIFTEKQMLNQHVGDCTEYSSVSDNILELKKRLLKEKEKIKSSNFDEQY